jgi:hypothetical protein
LGLNPGRTFPVCPFVRDTLWRLRDRSGRPALLFELGDIVGFEPAASDFFDELFELALGIENDAFGFDSE